MYGICTGPGAEVICLKSTVGLASYSLDSDFPFLVEMTVTRVFTKERDLKEIETEI